jgi:hypothetical protein
MASPEELKAAYDEGYAALGGDLNARPHIEDPAQVVERATWLQKTLGMGSLAELAALTGAIHAMNPVASEGTVEEDPTDQ